MYRSFKIRDTNSVPLVDTNLYKIVLYEYFIGEVDPGIGNGDRIEIAIPFLNSIEQVSVPSGSLPIGIHKVTFRAQDESGAWSNNFTQEFEVCLNPPLGPELVGEVLFVKEEGI